MNNRSKVGSPYDFSHVAIVLIIFIKSLVIMGNPYEMTGMIYLAFFNAYTSMHVLDSHLQITSDVNPLDYGFKTENATHSIMEIFRSTL